MAVPVSANVTATVLQDCCSSGEVHRTDGCKRCYVQNPSAEDGLMFNEDFTECLRRQANACDLTRRQTSYRNMPNHLSTSAAPSLRGWGGWVFGVLLGLRVVFWWVFRH